MDTNQEDGWRILLIDQEEADYGRTRELLSQSQGKLIHLDWADSYEAGQSKLGENSYDAALVEYDLGDRTGLHLIRESSPGSPAWSLGV